MNRYGQVVFRRKLAKLVFSEVITLLGLTAPLMATPSAASIGRAIFQDTNLSRPSV